MTHDHRPYFNLEARQFLIQGSYKIRPLPPITVGSTRQLLMDDFIVDSTWNCFRCVHEPDKHPGNPVLPTGLDQGGFHPSNVLFDEDERKFHLWTRILNPDRPSYQLNQVHVYFESEDGFEWKEPELGIVEYDGSKANNIIQGAHGFMHGPLAVIRAPSQFESRGRYVMLYLLNKEKFEPNETHGAEQRLAWSDDAIHWQDQKENPVSRGRFDTHNSLTYNPDRDVFMVYQRACVNAHEIRRIAYSESSDGAEWMQPVIALDPDDMDPPSFYGMPVTRYQNVYLGFLQMFYSANAGYKTGPRLWKDGYVEKENKIDVQLAWSRDGVNWKRHPKRPIFLKTGIAGSYDWGATFIGQGIIERGDLLYLYYASNNINHKPISAGRKFHVNLATLRRDGFVSLFTPGLGYMLTKPLLCPGNRLHINAQTEKEGYIRVAVRDGDGVDDGEWLDGWDFEDGPVFTGDTTDTVLEWKQKDFNTLKGRSIRLHFWLHKARAFSFWFQ